MLQIIQFWYKWSNNLIRVYAGVMNIWLQIIFCAKMSFFMGDTGDWKLALLKFTCEGFLFTCDGVTVEVWRCCRCQCSRLRYIQLFKISLLAVWTSSEVIVAITAIKSSILAWRQLTISSQNIQTKSVC